MENNEFKIGDVVTLKNGSPDLIITFIQGVGENKSAMVCWWDGNIHTSDLISLECFMKVEK